jgi:hypothetical protein
LQNKTPIKNKKEVAFVKESEENLIEETKFKEMKEMPQKKFFKWLSNIVRYPWRRKKKTTKMKTLTKDRMTKK